MSMTKEEMNREIAKLLAAHFPLPPEDRIKELQASLGAIHYHSKDALKSETEIVKLFSIIDECERCIPELRNMEINGLLSRVKGTEFALSVDTVKELADRWERADLAYKCLAQISTEKLAENGMGKEATAISWARVALQTPFAPRENLGLPNSD